MIIDSSPRQNRHTHLVQIAVQHRLLERIDRQAEEEVITRSALLRRAAVEYLQRVKVNADAQK